MPLQRPLWPKVGRAPKAAATPKEYWIVISYVKATIKTVSKMPRDRDAHF